MASSNGRDFDQVWWRFECPVRILCGWDLDRILCWDGYHKCKTDQDAQEVDAS
jgi:hypothetical protein